MKAALYLRVSKEEQHTENQLPELRNFAQRNGWETVEYSEHLSGREGKKRPELMRLLEDAKQKKFGAVIVWKMDRFGRSVKDFMTNVQVLDDAGVRFITTSQPIDTDQRSPFGKLIMIILMAVAEFERDLTIERVRLGVVRFQKDHDAGKVGKTVHTRSGKDKGMGRPRKFFDRGRIAEMMASGLSLRKIAKQFKVTEGTIRFALKAQA